MIMIIIIAKGTTGTDKWIDMWLPEKVSCVVYLYDNYGRKCTNNSALGRSNMYGHSMIYPIDKKN